MRKRTRSRAPARCEGGKYEQLVLAGGDYIGNAAALLGFQEGIGIFFYRSGRPLVPGVPA